LVDCSELVFRFVVVGHSVEESTSSKGPSTIDY
jgi:hypothetical protein